MFAWNLISLIIVACAVVEAYQNNWRFPKFNSFATVAVLWFVGSLALYFATRSL